MLQYCRRGLQTDIPTYVWTRRKIVHDSVTHACFLIVVQRAYIHLSTCPKGCVCMLSLRCECVCVCCVTRAQASCCSVCINTLLGLSELSVNWVGESLCAARVSAARLQTSLVFTNA